MDRCITAARFARWPETLFGLHFVRTIAYRVVAVSCNNSTQCTWTDELQNRMPANKKAMVSGRAAVDEGTLRVSSANIFDCLQPDIAVLQ